MEFDKAVFEGKTIVSASLHYEPGAWDDLIIKFDDGTQVTVHALGCNDDTGALTFTTSAGQPPS